MTIMDKPVQGMTWRELKDTVANILLEWPAFLDRLRENMRPKQNLKQVLHLVNLCASRFGKLAFIAAGEDLLDDTSETQPCREAELQDKITLTAGALRRMVGSLLIMYRHLHLLSMCSKVPKQHYTAGVSKYHYEASNDAFNLLCMHIALPVAARLNYRHDFPGMFNHVSQVGPPDVCSAGPLRLTSCVGSRSCTTTTASTRECSAIPSATSPTPRQCMSCRPCRRSSQRSRCGSRRTGLIRPRIRDGTGCCSPGGCTS